MLGHVVRDLEPGTGEPKLAAGQFPLERLQNPRRDPLQPRSQRSEDEMRGASTISIPGKSTEAKAAISPPSAATAARSGSVLQLPRASRSEFDVKRSTLSHLDPRLGAVWAGVL